MTKLTKKRCSWPGEDKLMIKYHDHEWGTPQHDDGIIFEYLVLDTFQAGLSWQIVLNKRENFRKALDGFSPEKVSRYGQSEIGRLLNDSGIIRNRLKIAATITNSQKFLEVQKEFGTFDKYVWQFVGEEVIQNSWAKDTDLPVSTLESEAMSTDMKKRGFKFVGTTICYAFMQAAGMVNDHTTDCFRHAELSLEQK